MEHEELVRRLRALSVQQGHPGTIDISDVADRIEQRDEIISHLKWSLEEERLGEDA